MGLEPVLPFKIVTWKRYRFCREGNPRQGWRALTAGCFLEVLVSLTWREGKTPVGSLRVAAERTLMLSEASWLALLWESRVRGAKSACMLGSLGCGGLIDEASRG